MNEQNEIKLNPCPYCRKIYLFYDRYDRKQYKVNCDCGFAWKVSRFKNTKAEAAEAWNKKIKK